MPLNRMHYIKRGVNSSSLTEFWFLRKVCGTLDRCCITTHSIHNKGDLQIYFCVIFLETRHPQAHITSGALIDCALSLAARRTQDGSGVGLISLANVCYGDSQVTKHFLRPNLVFQPIWGGAILALSSFLNQIPHQKEPEISVGVFSPT